MAHAERQSGLKERVHSLLHPEFFSRGRFAPEPVVRNWIRLNLAFPQREGGLKSGIITAAIEYCKADPKKWEQFITRPLSPRQERFAGLAVMGAHKKHHVPMFTEDERPEGIEVARTLRMQEQYKAFIEHSLRGLENLMDYVDADRSIPYYIPPTHSSLPQQQTPHHLAEFFSSFPNGKARAIYEIAQIPMNVILAKENRGLIAEWDELNDYTRAKDPQAQARKYEVQQMLYTKMVNQLFEKHLEIKNNSGVVLDYTECKEAIRFVFPPSGQ